MGFYEEKFSEVLRFPIALQVKETLAIGKIERLGKVIDRMRKSDFPKLVEEKHKVTAFIARLHEFVRIIRSLGKTGYRLIYHELLLDMQGLEELKNISNVLHHNWKKLPDEAKAMVASILVKQVHGELSKEEITSRNEYSEVSAVISEAQAKDHEQFMASVRLKVKNKDELRNFLEGVSWKRGVRSVRRKVAELSKLKGKIKTTIGKMRGKKPEQLSEFEGEMQQVATDVAVLNREGYLVRERAILITLKIFSAIIETEDYLAKMAKKHYIPAETAQRATQRLQKGMAELGKDFQNVVAQEFRIDIADIHAADAELLKQTA